MNAAINASKQSGERSSVTTALAFLLCVPVLWAAPGQHPGAAAHPAASRPAYARQHQNHERRALQQENGDRSLRPANSRPAYERPAEPQAQPRPAYRAPETTVEPNRPAPASVAPAPVRPAYSAAPDAAAEKPSIVRPAYSGSSRPFQPTASAPHAPAANLPQVRPALPAASAPRPNYAPAGHLGDWLNQHSSAPVQDQERLLRNSPSFSGSIPPSSSMYCNSCTR